MLLCPDCALPLREEPAAGIRVDRCARCGGIWFDLGELGVYRGSRAWVGKALPAFRVSPKEESKRCPRCESKTLRAGSIGGGQSFCRCEECKGAFVPRQTLAKFEPGHHPAWDIGGALKKGAAAGAAKAWELLLKKL